MKVRVVWLENVFVELNLRDVAIEECLLLHVLWKLTISFWECLCTQTQLLGEKQGYMHKLDPRLKNWTRRWFVLKGKELKYYRSKVCQFLSLSLSLSPLSCSFVIFPSDTQECWNCAKPKGIINLAQWCRITRHEMTSSFQVSVCVLFGWRHT